MHKISFEYFIQHNIYHIYLTYICAIGLTHIFHKTILGFHYHNYYNNYSTIEHSIHCIAFVIKCEKVHNELIAIHKAFGAQPHKRMIYYKESVVIAHRTINIYCLHCMYARQVIPPKTFYSHNSPFTTKLICDNKRSAIIMLSIL